MEKKTSKRLWVAAILLCTVALVTGIYLTYSAYTGSSFLKAVAATGTSQALFASDLLEPSQTVGGAIASKPVVVDSTGDATEGTCSFTFKIYNCLLDDQNVVNNKDVKVRLSVTATGAGTKGAQDGWTISPDDTIESGAQEAVSFPGYTPTVKIYTIAFAGKYLNSQDLAFTIRADVVDGESPGTNLAFLAAKVVPGKRATVTSAQVTGEWVNKASSASSFDAYDYRVTVTGKGSLVTLTWGSGVEIDPYFYRNHIKAADSTEHPQKTTDSGKSSVTFYMEPGSEIVNFFRADGSTKPSRWGDIDVMCTGAN